MRDPLMDRERPVPTLIFSILLLPLLLVLPLGAARANPSLEWSDMYDGGTRYLDYATSAVCDPQGNLVVGGESADGVDGIDMLIRKLSRVDGSNLWTTRWTAFDTNDMALSGLVLDPFGDVLVGGYIRGCVG